MNFVMLKRTQKGKSTNKQRGDVERMEFRTRKIFFTKNNFSKEITLRIEKDISRKIEESIE